VNEPVAQPARPAGDPGERKRRRIAVLCLAALGLLTVAAALGYMLRTPPLPEEWRRVSVGMSREELLRVAPGHEADMRDLKGFDMFIRRYRLLLRPCWWQMFVTYDDDGNVRGASASFTDPNCGRLSMPRVHICGPESRGSR
jgi:hypothetical protein